MLFSFPTSVSFIKLPLCGHVQLFSREISPVYCSKYSYSSVFTFLIPSFVFLSYIIIISLSSLILMLLHVSLWYIHVIFFSYFSFFHKASFVWPCPALLSWDFTSLLFELFIQFCLYISDSEFTSLLWYIHVIFFSYFSFFHKASFVWPCPALLSWDFTSLLFELFIQFCLYISDSEFCFFVLFVPALLSWDFTSVSFIKLPLCGHVQLFSREISPVYCSNIHTVLSLHFWFRVLFFCPVCSYIIIISLSSLILMQSSRLSLIHPCYFLILLHFLTHIISRM